MKKTNIFKLATGLAFFFLIIYFVFLFTGVSSVAGPLLITFFVLLSIGVRGFKAVKGYAYTIWIFTSVAVAMYYPQPFISLGNFQVKTLIVPLLQIIMFGMGSQMSLSDFTGIIKMPKGVIVGVGLQFLIMPLVALAISLIFRFPPEIAAGIILIGVVPSGLASNVMSFIARANLALAVTIGAISTLLSPLVTPFLMKLIGGQFIEVDFWSMMLDILNMIILPIVAGFIFNLFIVREKNLRYKIIQLLVYFVILVLTTLVFVKSTDANFRAFLLSLLKSMAWFYFLPIAGALFLRHYIKEDREILRNILSMFSMVGIAVIITIITAAGRESLLQVGALLLLTSLLHNISGYSLGYGVSWLLRMPEQDRRTIAFEVGMQNGGLASGLALQIGKMATVGLAPAIFSSLMNVTGSTLANFWQNRPPKTTDTTNSENNPEEITNKK
jgi:bile acid:Na+ symporter, BASS family